MRSGIILATLPVTLAADTLSITVMGITYNAIMPVVSGAMETGLASPLFYDALALVVAFVAAFPVNRFLIARGWGHTFVYEHHCEH